MSKEEAAFRIEEAVRTGARELDLSGLGLGEIPERLRELTGLVELGLSSNRITELPDFIGGFRNLRILDLRGNRLTRLPPGFGDLTGLVRLQLHSNHLADVPEPIGRLTRLEELVLGNNRIRHLSLFLFGLVRLGFLDLYGNRLTDLPSEIARLKSLTALDLGSNRLTALPESIGECTGLTTLDLSDNLLRELPETIGALRRLARLVLSRNRLERLPDAFGRLRRLTNLDLNGNRLERLPAGLGEFKDMINLNLSGNRLTDVPADLSHVTELMTLNLSDNDLPPELEAANAQGTETVMAYLREQEIDTVAIRQVKLVVLGEGGVGKSSLVAALNGDPFIEDRPLTHGLEIKTLTPRDGTADSLEFNAWDFGGQSIHRPFHQLFFTEPAIYIVAWNPRTEAARDAVGYWVDLVRQRVGQEARIHIVATHADVHDHLGDLDRARLEHGGPIAGTHHIGSRTERGIPELRSALTATASKLPHLERSMPTRWHTLLEELKAEDTSHLEISDYLDRARSHGLDENSARSLARVATELGLWCHFPDVEELKDLVILRADWLNQAVSLALDDPRTRDRYGFIPHARLTHLWNAAADNYPAHVHPALIELMHEFQIAYPIHDSPDGPASLITRLVPAREQGLQEWKQYGTALPEQSYVIEFRDPDDRPMVPEGLMFQLIAWFHRFALKSGDQGHGLHWASGMVLDHGHHGRALIRIDDDRMVVTVKAAYPTYLCKMIADDVCNRLKKWKGLTPITLVRCGAVCAAPNRPGAGSMWFEVGRLQSFKAAGHDHAACSRCNENAPLDALIGEFGAMAAARNQSDDETAVSILAILRSLQGIVEKQGEMTRSYVSAELERALKEVKTRSEDLFEQAFRLLADEGREGPRLFMVKRDDSISKIEGMAQYRIRVTLYCEHSRRPVHELDEEDGKGVYTFDVDREWLVKARPWIKLAARLIQLTAALASPGLKLGLEESGWKDIESEVALGSATAKELASSASDLADRENADPAFGDEVPFGEATRGQIHHLHKLLTDLDPDFAGLKRVRERGRYLWVHKNFAHHYE